MRRPNDQRRGSITPRAWALLALAVAGLSRGLFYLPGFGESVFPASLKWLDGVVPVWTIAIWWLMVAVLSIYGTAIASRALMWHLPLAFSLIGWGLVYLASAFSGPSGTAGNGVANYLLFSVLGVATIAACRVEPPLQGPTFRRQGRPPEER